MALSDERSIPVAFSATSEKQAVAARIMISSRPNTVTLTQKQTLIITVQEIALLQSSHGFKVDTIGIIQYVNINLANSGDTEDDINPSADSDGPAVELASSR